jgi:lactoylglutathione lyase
VAGESTEAGRKFAMLQDGSGLVLTLWQQSEGRFEATRPGLHHLSFQVPSMDDVHAVEERLRAMGASMIYDGIVPHGEGAQSGGIFFEDPDGIRLEIFSPTGAADMDVPTPGAPSCGFF